MLYGSRIQSNVRAAQSHDQFEQEADHVAARVMQQKRDSAAVSSIDGPIIQRQEQTEPPKGGTGESSGPILPSASPGSGSARTSRCYDNPEFPNFPCLASALKLDIDENLWANAHQFYRVASLYPGNNELMWETFMRYGLGVNLLQTSFGFLGADETLGTALSYGTGVGLKTYNFFQNGVLELDIPVSLGGGLNLDFQLDLNADPDNLTSVQGVNTGVGLSGHF